MGLRAEGDLRNEKINYKVREHSLAKVSSAARWSQKGGCGANRLDPPPRQRQAADDAARCGTGRARAGSVPPDVQRVQKAA